MLVNSAVQQAAALGVQDLWLYTADSRKMYENMGWIYVSDDMYLGEMVSIMKHPLNSKPL